jgi:two-component system, sensor histidine kinase
MSHEIRIPLNGVMGMSDQLLDMPLEGEARQCVLTLRDCAEHLLRLVDGVLDLSKLEAGRMQLEEIPFAVGKLAQSVCDLLAPQARGKGIALRLNLSPDLPEIIVGDPARLRQVLTNLVDNAVKFTAQGSVDITITAAGERENGIALAFAVRDTGIGIAPDALQHLCKEYFQADASIARRFGGSGLGLAICRRLVAAMRGEMTIESRPGQGSLFEFTAWFGRNSGARHGTDRRIRLLLVDDDRTSRLIATRLLEKSGHHVDVAADGGEAVAALGTAAYDLVLMDLRMPGMDGLRTVRAIRALSSAMASVPIVALSGNVTAEDRVACRDAGVSDVLQKPVSAERLDAAIAAALAGEAGDPDAAALIAALGNAAGPIIAGFLAETEQRLGRMRAMGEAADMASLAREAHALKSAAASFGCRRLAELAAMLEENIAQSGTRDVDRIVAAMIAEFRAISPPLAARFGTAA